MLMKVMLREMVIMVLMRIMGMIKVIQLGAMMVMMNQIVVMVMRTILQMNNDDSVNGGIDDDDNKDDYDSDAENDGVKVVLRWRHFFYYHTCNKYCYWMGW